MFLAQSFKKFLKDNFQEPKNVDQEKGRLADDLFDGSDTGLFNNNDLITNPAYSSLLCNIYHDDRPLNSLDEK